MLVLSQKCWMGRSRIDQTAMWSALFCISHVFGVLRWDSRWNTISKRNYQKHPGENEQRARTPHAATERKSCRFYNWIPDAKNEEFLCYIGRKLEDQSSPAIITSVKSVSTTSASAIYCTCTLGVQIDMSKRAWQRKIWSFPRDWRREDHQEMRANHPDTAKDFKRKSGDSAECQRLESKTASFKQVMQQSKTFIFSEEIC